MEFSSADPEPRNFLIPPEFGRSRQILATLAYAGVATVSFIAAHGMIFGGFDILGLLREIAGPLAVLVVLRVVLHRAFRLMLGRWRFVSIHDVLRLALSTTTGTLVFWAAIGLGAVDYNLAIRFLVLEWMLTMLLTAGAWISYRLAYEASQFASDPTRGARLRTVIVGAGEAGILMAREIRRAPTGLNLLGFIDDDPTKIGRHILGQTVLGSTDELDELVERYHIEHVIISIPSARPDELSRMVAICEDIGVDFRVLPGVASVLSGDVSLQQLRKVTIEDLLGRQPVRLDLPELEADLRGGVVLITGAAGSIGSELSRQIAANHPDRLILLDQAESDLFFVEMEIEQAYPELGVRAIVGDVTDAERIEAVISAFRATHVYHAAAYKHVPLMEHNVTEAVRNNVRGTRNVFEAAGRHGVKTCVLVSTDKAVNPSNVMGATKRVCELMMLSAVERFPRTRFTAVRFGNVLGSKGSVVEVFRRQLESGRLTVTHPEITRYFMTIPEAVRLILTASMLPEAAGRIAMLEMGDPTRIVDLARSMIRLSGLEENRDVVLDFTGLRPGEKMHEELVSDRETTESTQNGKIRLIQSLAADAAVEAQVARLLQIAEAGDSEASRRHLFEMTAEPVDEVPVVPVPR